MSNKQWNYKIEKLPIDTKQEQVDWLNNFGSLGWEMTGISNTTTAIYILFKRPMDWR